MTIPYKDLTFSVMTPSGLTLILLSLKALKELNTKKKPSPSPSLLSKPPTPRGAKKNHHPIKLKPLKEVLMLLITKIKKVGIIN